LFFGITYLLVLSGDTSLMPLLAHGLSLMRNQVEIYHPVYHQNVVAYQFQHLPDVAKQITF
jgi:hypothetical protein